MVDNVLAGGSIIEPDGEQSQATSELNDLIATDERVDIAMVGDRRRAHAGTEAMNRDRALELQKRSLWEWVGAMAAWSERASLFERDGVRAAIVPACPQRSLPNSIAYQSPAALAAALDDLAAAYDAAGVAARTVWVPEFDAEAIAVLEGAGYAFDGQPTAMSLELKSFEPLDVGDLEWGAESTPAELGRLNDLAYGFEDGDGMAAAMTAESPGTTLYEARLGGEPACVLGTMDHGSDLGFYYVATAPSHRGKGLASRLMSVALEDARKRGLETSTLQSSAMGRPVYEKLGYEPAFALHLYEHRVPA